MPIVLDSTLSRRPHSAPTPPPLRPHLPPQDSEVMVQVERDVMRTHPDMHFFTGDSPEAEAHREASARGVGVGVGRMGVVHSRTQSKATE